MKSMRMAVVVALGFSVLSSVVAVAQRGQGRGGEAASSPYPVVTGKAYRFEKVADGVYYATSAGTMVTGSNNILVVGDRDALVVDTGTSPAAARAMIEDVKLVTDKPIRHVVNSHFHYDHTDGNQVYAASKADVIAHEYVRFAIEKLDVLHREPYQTSQLTNVPNRIGTIKKQIAEEKDPARKATLEQQLSVAERGWEELKEIKPTPPNKTYAKRMDLKVGTHDVQLLFLGRGHTNGDTFVFLPKERIICTGDMLETAPSYMGDGQFDEWVATLGELQKVGFDLILPGHGRPMRGKAIIPAYQSYLTDLMNQVANLRKQGLTAEQTAERVDLTSHKADYPNIQRPGADLRGVRRMYEWMDERGKK
jgi:cyclase